MCLHPNQAHVLLRHIAMCTHKKARASRTTVPGPTKVLPDGPDGALKPVPFQVANILRKSRNGEVEL
ncbi:hypothetical protein E2C01_052974 [Portunus trituberculatus]|uniref:Uncharacterized protein n=1 Tax=Portunus trituberculatus TaxID=210409 RepID=A0A5B7GMX9_PORTR|nr:hypothetical protein [Portunus trituberculatus]